jgi:hypothetical protein
VPAGVRFEVVQEQHPLEPESGSDARRVDRPGQVRDLNVTVPDGAGDAEAGGGELGRVGGEERPHHLLERRMVAARVDLERDRLPGIAVDERQPRVRAADVAGEDQLWITSSACPPNSLRIADRSLSANCASPREEKRS